MQHYDMIIRNGTIMTMDHYGTMIEHGLVCISGDTIVHVGTDDDTSFVATKTIDALGGLILPGLINGHTHAAMSLFRGLADDLPLMEWLNNYIFPAESRMDSGFVHTGAVLACAEMILSGTTMFCDMYLFEDEVARAAKEAGMRCLVGEVLYDFPSPNYGPVEKGLEYTRRLIKKWQDDPLVNIAVEPHSLFTCSPELLISANEIAISNKAPLIIHVAETSNELSQIQEKYGCRPVEHLQSIGLLGPHIIAVHCVHVSDYDIRLLARHGVKVIHNPESNMKLASGICPVPELLEEGVIVGLGTDGCASNNNLDLFTEIDMAAKLHKVKAMDPTVMDAITVLKMATIEGARALGMDEMIGSIEVGKRADMIVLNPSGPHLVPMYNPYSNIVYSATGGDVSHSIINGRLVMEERRLLTLDLEKVLSDAKKRSSKVKSWLSERDVR